MWERGNAVPRKDTDVINFSQEVRECKTQKLPVKGKLSRTYTISLQHTQANSFRDTETHTYTHTQNGNNVI